MSESVEGVARAFVRAINRQDVDALAELMTEEPQRLFQELRRFASSALAAKTAMGPASSMLKSA